MSTEPLAKEKLIYRIIRILMGAVLMLFAFTQLIPAEPMEFRLVELGVANWAIAPWILRIFIGIELGVGLLLILNIDPKKRVSKLAGLVMVIMVFDLLGTMDAELVTRDDGFARPFGLPFVYAVILCVSFYVGVSLIQRKGKSLEIKWKWLKYVLFTLMLPVPFILYGIFSSELTDETATFNDPFDVSLISDSTLAHLDSSIFEGDKLIAFLSSDCSHCQEAAQKVAITAERYPDSPQPYAIFWSTEDGLKNFSEVTHTTFDHMRIEDSNEFFMTLNDPSVPAVLFLRDGIIRKRWKGSELNYFVLSNLANGTVDLGAAPAE